ncbi:hypothetical protein CLU93_5433 [Janthinobacterium sp. 35]|uniref:hypothetical protein n=1 Tax=Janthinobacterium sp. 35 TaxID=2035210 RepID=UPI000C183CEE|nr:hypothetical protein [Janthinobacterium sp. 35]PIG31080.1 hypothetical protein CLU93_5433 [Janthinobacterium sp. 35]
MKYMKRFTNSMLAACAIAFATLAMAMPAASAADHPQATVLVASTQAATPAPVGLDITIAAIEQKDIGVIGGMSDMPKPKPGASYLPRTLMLDIGNHADTHGIHAGREAERRTSA